MQANDLFLYLPVLLFSVVLHEYAHGWQALREGDDTAYMLGRLTLNPIPHIDLFGSILLPLMLALLNSPFMIGWAKPVPVNPRKYRNYRAGDIRVSLAGIVVNIGLAVIFTLVLVGLIHLAEFVPSLTATLEVLARMVQYGILVNLVLAFFNLIPIPPLDGGNVLAGLVPENAARMLDQVRQFGFLALYALLLSGVLTSLIVPPTDFFWRLLLR